VLPTITRAKDIILENFVKTMGHLIWAQTGRMKTKMEQMEYFHYHQSPTAKIMY
jgi:hypothetical protein